MERKILFKAKRVDNCEWVFGYLIKKQLHNKFDSPPSLMYEKWFIDKGSDINLFDGIFQQVEVHPETVCQFTGKLDKNGNKIFENDIVYHGENPLNKVVVVWNKRTCGFVLNRPNYKNEFTRISGLGKLKIIGNIHD